MSVAYCTIATAGTSLILGTASPLPLGLAIIGSQLPDLDTTTSTINGGGITQKVSQNLGLKDGVVELYNQNASTHQVYANITGFWASDR